MPIKPKNKALYPANWDQIRDQILSRAQHRCECRNECGSSHPGGACLIPNKIWVHRSIEDPPRWWGPFYLGPERAHWDQVRVPAGFHVEPVQIVLTIAHLNPDPANRELENLLALCQLCHNRLDAPMRAIHASETRRLKAESALAVTGQLSLFGGIA